MLQIHRLGSTGLAYSTNNKLRGRYVCPNYTPKVIAVCIDPKQNT